jgi:hypothetical protein
MKGKSLNYRKPVLKVSIEKQKINFEDRWFQVFDYLYRNYDMFAPVNNRKFEQFIKTLEINKPEIFNKLCTHLEEVSVEKIHGLFFKKIVDIMGVRRQRQ